jgi:hypothetical protein
MAERGGKLTKLSQFHPKSLPASEYVAEFAYKGLPQLFLYF